MSKNKADIVAVMGASGSGKSTFIKRAITKARPARLLVWDPMREYGEFGQVVHGLGELVAKVAEGGKRNRFNLVFQPCNEEKTRAKQFDVFCGLAMEIGNCAVVVEELKFVTKPSWAPMRWSAVTMQGRHKGLRVIGASQRPASIDKDFLGNCTVIHTGRLAYAEDVRAVAKGMQVEENDIANLKPLEWIEKNMQTGQISRGTLTF